MSSLRVRAKNGRLVLDEPTNLPEGTEVDLQFDPAELSLDATELPKRQPGYWRSRT